MFLLPLLALFFSCNKEEPIPAYIRINNFTFTTDYATQGSASHKITDAWVYLGGNLVGAFEMSATFPVVVAEGTYDLLLFAGIKENGISETRITYPFYQPQQQSVFLSPGKITTLTPSTAYIPSPGADFAWMEDFEAALSICSAASDTTKLYITTAAGEVFEKTGSGKVKLNSADISFLGQTCTRYVLPQNGQPVFLEFDYNCNAVFNTGISAYTASGTLLGQQISLSMNPTQGWNKIYVNLTTEITAFSTAADYEIFFSMLHDSNLSESYFYIDNIKLIF